MNNQGARAFLIGMALLALLPLVQQLFHPFKLAGLQGAFDVGKKPEFSADHWLKGTYQQQTDHYLKYTTAFNGDLVRLRNQVDYSVFGNINTILTLGKQNYIFDPSYIAALNGADLLTDSVRVAKTFAVKKTVVLLDSLKVPLYICIAPNKASYYETYLPNPINLTLNTNQAFFDSLLNQLEIPVIDFNNWFLNIRDTSAYRLVPKYGAHWSTYGAYVAADSLLDTLRSNSNEIFADVLFNKIELSDKARYTDDDYLASLNLLFKWKSPQMAYPVLNFTAKKTANVLIISDSFIWNFYDLGIIQNCFSKQSEIRYYNVTSFDNNKNNLGKAKFLKLEDLADRDFVIVLTSAPGLKNFGYGFFEAASKLAPNE